MESIGDRIKLRRKELNLTLKQVHEITGLSTGNLSDIENNKYAPSVVSLEPLSRVLGRSIDWIITGNDFKTDESPSLSNIESDINSMFRELDDRDKEDVFDYIKMKFDKTVKKGTATSSYSTYTETLDEPKKDHNKKGSGIA